MSAKKPMEMYDPSELMARIHDMDQAKAITPVELEEKPWLAAHPKLKVHFGLRIPEPLHKKFEYVVTHTMATSMQSFALQALDEAVHKELEDLGKHNVNAYIHLLGKALDAKKGEEPAWSVMSTGERLAVAIILDRSDWIASMGYTLAEAIGRLDSDWLSAVPRVARELKGR